MQIYTEEFAALKMAVGVLYERMDDLNDREQRIFDLAINAIKSATERLDKSNEKQARYMKERRRNLQGGM